MIRAASSADFIALKKILENTRSDWSPAILSDCFSSDYFIWMMGDLNQTMGFIVAKNNVDFWEILQIVIDQPYQRHGLASQLLKFVVGEAQQKQIQKIELEVRASNLAAITLYEKTGFVCVGFRKKYYSNGEDAVLMDYIPNGKSFLTH